ncbi:MAG: 16S rRNA (uracil(1498)-N(3))-methyltransferase [Polyangiales bacterium]
MAVHRIPLPKLAVGEALLPAAASRYIARVLRLRVGDCVEAFDPMAGVTATAEVVGIDVDRVTLRVDALQRAAERDALPVILVQGYPKGDKLGAVVRDATELGATLIIPAICARSVARPVESKLASRADRLAAIAIEAARQCGRARAPWVLAPCAFADAIEAARSFASSGFVLWEQATLPLKDELLALALRGGGDGVVFVVGPEGGLTLEEVTLAETTGFPARSLGATILRTETVAAAVLGAWRILAS